MNNSAAKVGEIFREAGTAFTKLSEMTLMLQPMDDSPSGGKWSDEDVEMLRGCINRFAVELNKISQHIKNRTIYQIRTTLKKKAFEDAGIPIPAARQVSSTVTSHTQSAPHVARAPRRVIILPAPPPPTALGQNAEVTLNMLNASENEDVDGLSGDVKLEFESTNDEVAT